MESEDKLRAIAIVSISVFVALFIAIIAYAAISPGNECSRACNNHIMDECRIENGKLVSIKCK